MTTTATRPTTQRPAAPAADRRAPVRHEPLPRLRVAVHCDDALSAAGLELLLRDFPDLALAPRHDRGPADVSLLVLDRVHVGDLTALGPSVHSRPRRVLVVDELDAEDFALARAAGVVGVLRRRDVTRTTLAALLRTAATAHAAPPGPGRDQTTVHGPLPRGLAQRHPESAPPARPGPHVAAEPPAAAAEPARSGPGAQLTDREIEVLRMLAAGCDTREIAHRLCYSERTVKTVIQDITRRFGLRNRSHAVAYAVRHGLA